MSFHCGHLYEKYRTKWWQIYIVCCNLFCKVLFNWIMLQHHALKQFTNGLPSSCACLESKYLSFLCLFSKVSWCTFVSVLSLCLDFSSIKYIESTICESFMETSWMVQVLVINNTFCQDLTCWSWKLNLF